ncbi:MAG TPA: hypothetical protein PKD67_10485 [Ignavibacteriaceae bacterium]|nr:hypothetical protein [Ignavibacteriaceae bacterium]
MSKIKIFIATLILGVFVLSFLHCELGFLSNNDYNHSFHDHCTIVKGSTVPTEKTNNNDLTKLKAVTVFIPNNIQEEGQNTLAFYSETDNPHYTEKTNKVYLHNSIFLI